MTDNVSNSSSDRFAENGGQEPRTPEDATASDPAAAQPDGQQQAPAAHDAIPPRPELPQTSATWTQPSGAIPGSDPFAAQGHAQHAAPYAQRDEAYPSAYAAPYAPQDTAFAQPAPGHDTAAGSAGYPPVGGDGQGVPPAFGGEKHRRKPKRAGVGMLVAGLAIGAIVGGASGAGAFAVIDGMQGGTLVSNGASGSSVTIQNNDEVTVTSAVAAKASPSVVTLSVSSGQSAGTGSGIVLSDDGYVLTNTHVVTLDGAVSDAAIRVTDADGNIYDATVVGTDPIYDLAVVKLEGASGLTPMTFGDSSKVNVGDAAVAIGAPLGLSGTVTDGIVSSLNRSITVASSAVPDDTTNENDGGDSDDPFSFGNPGDGDTGSSSADDTISLAVIQTDAAINPGNSGGALVNDDGELIGVNVAIAGTSSSDSESQSGSIGVGFAIPSNIAKRIADEIIDDGSATHGLLGAQVTDSASSSDATVTGALIAEVTSDGAAKEAGLEAGDIVTKFDDVPITNATDLTAQVRGAAAGTTVTLTYVRDGKTYEVDVTLGSL